MPFPLYVTIIDIDCTHREEGESHCKNGKSLDPVSRIAPTQLSAAMKMFYFCLSKMVATGLLRPVSIWNEASENEVLILANLNLNGHMRLMATILDSATLTPFQEYELGQVIKPLWILISTYRTWE